VGCDVTEDRQRLVIGLASDAMEYMPGIEHMVVDPDRGEPQFLGPARKSDNGLYVLDAPVVMQRETDLHGMILLYNGQEPKESGSPSTLWMPNASSEPRPKAEARNERKL
jgi:hypothetical protein